MFFYLVLLNTNSLHENIFSNRTHACCITERLHWQAADRDKPFPPLTTCIFHDKLVGTRVFSVCKSALPSYCKVVYYGIETLLTISARRSMGSSKNEQTIFWVNWKAVFLYAWIRDLDHNLLQSSGLALQHTSSWRYSTVNKNHWHGTGRQG